MVVDGVSTHGDGAHIDDITGLVADAVVAQVLGIGAVGGHGAGIDGPLDDDLRLRRHRQVHGLALDHLQRFPQIAAHEVELDDALPLGRLQHRGVVADDQGDLHGPPQLRAAPGDVGAVVAGIDHAAEPVPAHDHVAVDARVGNARVRPLGDHEPGADVLSRVELGVVDDGQQAQVHVVAHQLLLLHRRVPLGHPHRILPLRQLPAQHVVDLHPGHAARVAAQSPGQQFEGTEHVGDQRQRAALDLGAVDHRVPSLGRQLVLDDADLQVGIQRLGDLDIVVGSRLPHGAKKISQIRVHRSVSP